MKAKKRILQNGLRIITVPMDNSETVAVYVLADAGTKYETKSKNGISHFLEHVCFKGTEKRPTSLLINAEFDGIGAQVNAFTSHEYTGYHARAHAKHFPRIIDALGDMYMNSVFPKEEIEKEKGVILEEINMYEDLPQRKASVLFDALLHGDQPAGWSILGRKEVIKSITPKDFRQYRDRHYVASATTVVVAGNIKEAEVVREVKKVFKNIATTKKQTKKKVREKQVAPQFLLLPKKSDQTHLVLGVRAFPAHDKRSVALSLLNTILGEGMSARLFQKLRDEMGICYYVRSTADEMTDHGSLFISAGVDTTRILPAVEAILSECKKLVDEMVSSEELAKAKEYAIGRTYLSLETSDALAGYYGIQELLKLPLETPQEFEKKIRAVTAQDIQKLARQIFVDKHLNCVAVGKTPSEKALRSVLKWGT